MGGIGGLSFVVLCQDITGYSLLRTSFPTLQLAAVTFLTLYSIYTLQQRITRRSIMSHYAYMGWSQRIHFSFPQVNALVNVSSWGLYLHQCVHLCTLQLCSCTIQVG
jgi:hypothetical protein